MLADWPGVESCHARVVPHLLSVVPWTSSFRLPDPEPSIFSPRKRHVRKRQNRAFLAMLCSPKTKLQNGLARSGRSTHTRLIHQSASNGARQPVGTKIQAVQKSTPQARPAPNRAGLFHNSQGCRRWARPPNDLQAKHMRSDQQQSSTEFLCLIRVFSIKQKFPSSQRQPTLSRTHRCIAPRLTWNQPPETLNLPGPWTLDAACPPWRGLWTSGPEAET